MGVVQLADTVSPGLYSSSWLPVLLQTSAADKTWDPSSVLAAAVSLIFFVSGRRNSMCGAGAWQSAVCGQRGGLQVREGWLMVCWGPPATCLRLRGCLHA